jgi:hypothetical protein
VDSAENFFFDVSRFGDFGGRDDLTGVALGVVGEMDEYASDGGGKVLSADGARFIEIRFGEGADALGCVVKPGIEFGEELVARDAGVGFGLHGRNLCGGELIALRVGEQAIKSAGNMAQMEGDGCESERRSVKIGVGQLSGPEVNVFLRQLKGVQNGAEDGG